MTDPRAGLPRRAVEPLPPPPGRFDEVLGRAKQRRQRRALNVLGVVAVFLAGLGGGMSIDGGVTQVPQAILEIATEQVAGSDTSTAASKKPRTAAPTQEAASQEAKTAVAPSTQPARLAVRGQALTPRNTPIPGLYVYPGRPGADGFVPTRRPATLTGRDGRFEVACTDTPVLLSPWLLNRPAGNRAAIAQWAATFVGGATDPTSAAPAPCSGAGEVTTVVLQRGSALEGTAQVPSSCDSGQPLWVLLSNERDLTVRVRGVRDGEAFRVAGLPPGRHTVGANGARTKVTVGGGATVMQDVTFACDRAEPSQSPGPATPTPPDPLPSPDPEPLPSVTPTEEPGPRPTGMASPSPTGT